MIFGNFGVIVRDLVKFNKREQREVVIASILFGFIMAFRKWGGATFDVQSGITAWVFASLFFLIAIMFNLFIQKSFSLTLGYATHYYFWFQGIVIGLIVAFATYGYFPLLFPGFTYYEHVKRLRLGKFRYGWNIKDLVVPAISGVFSNIVLALIASMFYVKNNSPLLLLFIKINFLFAFYSLLPIPRLQGLSLGEGATPGLHIFFFQRQLYAFVLVSIVAYAGLIYLAATAWQSFFLLVLALALGLGAMAMFVRMWEAT